MNALVTPRDLADFVIDEARKCGIDQAAAIRAEDILAVLAAAGRRAAGAAVRQGAGDLLRGLVDAVARRIDGVR